MKCHNLYFVQNSSVTLIMTPSAQLADIPDCDDEAVLAFATSDSAAMALACQYDVGLIQPDNVTMWTGQTVAALR